MPEHRTRGRTRRGLAAALIVPAAVVAALFTAAGVASGNNTAPAAAETQLPSPLQPGGGATDGGNGGTTGNTATAPTKTGPTTTRTSPTGTRTTGPGAPGGGAASPTGTATGTSCVTLGGTPSPSGTRTGGGVVPGQPTRTSPSPTRTSHTGTGNPTGTATSPGGTGTLPGTVNVPGAAQPTGPTGGMPGTSGPTTPGTARTSPTHSPTHSPTGTASPGAPVPTTAATILRIGTAGGKSNVIVDQNGCALYLNTQDTPSQTNTDTAAEVTWIPALAPAEVNGPGLDQAKVGEFTRPDGKRQATYNGHQLYRFAGDRAPGQANGQGVDDKYFLIGQNGEPSR